MTELDHGQVMVIPDGSVQQTAQIKCSPRVSRELESERAGGRRLDDVADARFRWEVSDFRQSPFSDGIAILPPARKVPALAGPRVLSGLSHDTVRIRVDGIATNDGGSPVQSVKIYRSRFLSELPESQRPA